MNKDYLIIHKSILPDFFEQVLTAKGLVDDKKMSVCEACKLTDISRSTFYKYRDNVFLPSKSYGKKAIIAIKTADRRGVLSAILTLVYKFQANVITINQDMPIKDSAYITVALDISDMESDVNELLVELKELENVKSATVIAVD